MQILKGSTSHLKGQPPSNSNLNDTRLPIKQTNLESKNLGKQTRQCRICLSSQEISGNPFESPCECAGSLKFVHRNCLKKWLEIRIPQILDKQNGKESVHCELCKAAIKIRIELKRECRNTSSIYFKIKQSLLLFTVCLIGMVISLSVFFYSAFVLSQQIQIGFNQVDPIQKSVVLVSLPIELLLFLYFGFTILNFCIKKRATLEFDDSN